MSGKESYSYDDEIDLYGDAEARPSPPPSDAKIGEETKPAQGSNSNSRNNDGYGSNSRNDGYTSIPTFISEARGGTGVLPARDESGRSNRQGSSDANANAGQAAGGDGVLPRRGDYGSPGQWQTKPISTVRPSDMPEEGKMFIGGLNWETTEEGMRKYFEQFGEVTHCTIMHDPQTGRSRGFGFLTFADASAVNTVMVKEHYLDGKIIDPKRAIPRPEVGAVVRQDKLFVRQIPQSMDYAKFKEYFSQFGGVVDSNLMVDRETGMHRGFGFITYDDPAGASNALSQAHYFDGQELEVKMATQKTRNQDTYVGDRPNRNRDFGHRGPQQGMGGGGGMQGGGMMGNNNNMGGGMSNNMGGMNPMGNMNMGQGGGNMMGGMGGGGGGGQAAFDPMAMAQFFKQMGWGNFPMQNMFQSMMGGGMMGNQGGMMGGQGGMIPNMMGQEGMMNMMGGSGSPMNMGMNNMQGGMGGSGNMGQQQGDGGSAGFRSPPPTGPRSQQTRPMRSAQDSAPPPDAPKGPRSSGQSHSGTGPMRGAGRGSARDHPYR